jgi:cytochrome oxidase Cu insertion factor (SCO1/SenC/PrrC family)
VTPRNINRLKLLGIGVLALLPVVGSYLLYWFWAPEDHTNYGTLIDARPLPDAPLALVGGKPFSIEQLRGRWVLAVIDSGACPPRCEERLWLIRQVRQAQGEQLKRVDRVWLIDDGQIPDARLERDYAGTWFVAAQAQPILDAFGPQGARRGHIYLVDPLGNVMMRFPQNPQPRSIIRDLSRLLKYSSTG